MAHLLDDLLNDGRLERLFSTNARHCALQLWILQIKSEQSIENRIIYGRLLPYNHSNDSWIFSDNSNLEAFGQVKAEVTRLNLYIKSIYCADLLRRLCAGQTISAISDELKLGLSDKVKARFGRTALSANNVVYRPVTYQLNRDAYDRGTLSSPHGGAGAFSASITQTDKMALFLLGQHYNAALAESIIKQLNADTGLDFGGSDTTRFGDIELLVFPALDDLERSLLSVSWTDAPHVLNVRFDPIQVPHFIGFQFRLSITNEGQIIYSGIATAESDAKNVFECKFELDEQLREITDSTELEIFGVHGNPSCASTLCCRWQIGYFRELHLQGNVVGAGASPVKFDWLKKTTRPSASARVKAALTLNRSSQGFASHIGKRKADLWVPANRELVSLFAQLHPPKSAGRFFLRWGQGDGDGRLLFVEWFRELLSKHQQHQIVIFDPYFEDVGLSLLLLSAVEKTNCIVFRSLPKPARDAKPMRRKSDRTAGEGFNNLLANCEQNSPLLNRINLRIYGLKEGRLHDRYILIIGPNGLPVSGFNLSNSLQKAAENYPLLITPIPADVLLTVEQYKSELIRESEVPIPEGESENAAIRTLFSSSASSRIPLRYEPLRFLDKANAGDVLSIWTGVTLLQGLSSEQLKERMAALNLLKDESLTLPETASLRHYLEQQAGNFENFTATWEVLGDLLAHSHNEENHFRELESEPDFLNLLAIFLEASFKRDHNALDRELAVIEAHFFLEPIQSLLQSPYKPYHLSHAIKYAALRWSEYFAIKFLWWNAPDILLEMTEAQMTCVLVEPHDSDVVRLSLLSQIVSEISLSVQFEIYEEQRDRLKSSNNGLLQWLGLNAIELQLDKPDGFVTVQRLLADFSCAEQVRALGWMVNHVAKNPDKADIYKRLVAAIHNALPPTIPSDELRHLIDFMRGHMRQLAWTEPWLFMDVISPLLNNGRASTDDACDIWMQELSGMLAPQQKGVPQMFNLAREGQTTNIAAFLYAHSSPERQEASLKILQAILKRQKQIIHQPLASTSDWTRWDGALTVSMWILALARWGQYYLREGRITDIHLEALSWDAGALAMVRPMDEWRSKGGGNQSELAAFLDQVEDLMASSNSSISKL
ncbi:MAG: VPA1262 family protein [Gallionella sp.]|jgi:hypothetical protein